MVPTVALPHVAISTTLPLVMDQLQPLWSHVRQMRKEVELALADHPERLRKATAMTAAELLENAIKYGESVPAAAQIVFSLTATPEFIQVQVVNGCTDREGVGELARRIERVSNVSDREEFYMARLQELLEQPEQSGQLGIYRIGFEGGFDLACTYLSDCVTVTATRRVQ